MCTHFSYSQLITIENLFQAWEEFKKGKGRKADVQLFERHLEDNLFELHGVLRNKTYRHGDYESFYVHDPKLRHIHKAQVRDRVVHHLLYTFLYQLFDKTFIYDSYSCRLGKGTHKGVDRLELFTGKVSKNYTRPCWALKCDIKKFFSSIDHKILFILLRRRIEDQDILWLLAQVIESFHSEHGNGKGIPLGNLTSQVFANIYLNELDQFVKHILKIKYYIRYADDFIILDSRNRNFYQYTSILVQFLKQHLKLELHPKKIVIRKLEWGIDFLGYNVLAYYRLPRTKTKKRIFRKIKERIGDYEKGKISDYSLNQSLQSYLGFFGHSHAYQLTKEVKNRAWFWSSQESKPSH